LSTVEALALYPSATAVGSDSDNGAASAGTTEETPTVAMTTTLFSMKARRERLIDLSSLQVPAVNSRLFLGGRGVEDAAGPFLGYS
jgi:hypothetical protein